MAASQFLSWTAPANHTPPARPDAPQRAEAGPNPPQGKTELMTRADTATTEIIDTLDSFYCYNVTAALWADAVINRLEGLAIFLLGDELAEIADRARAAARRLADRIGDLGGAITADPRQLLDRSIPVEFVLPDCSDVASIGE
jgi:hypothetical protein